MNFKLTGILIILFGRRWSFSLGFGGWMVPAIHITLADHFLAWTGFQPFRIDHAYVHVPLPVTFGGGIIFTEAQYIEDGTNDIHYDEHTHVE